LRCDQSRTATVFALVLALFPALTSPAFAARTDVVVLRNGDRITCEVQRMRQGKLQVKTDDVGTLSIEWDKIASITTAAMFDVTMRDGSRLLGRLTSPRPQTLDVVASGASATTVSMGDVAAFDTIKAPFLKRIDGSVDFGGSYTKSSGVADLFFDAEATYRRPSYFYDLSFATNLTRQPDAPETARYTLQIGYTRARSNGWLVSSFGLFESNQELGFDLRGTGALTLGRYLVRSSHVEMMLAGGFAAGREKPIDADAVTNVDGLIVSDLSVFTYDYPTTRVDLGLLVFPSLDDPGRVRVNLNAKVKREIYRDFFVSVSGYDAFDNRPRTAAAARNDFGASLSFGWTF
jgi:hypothetical protein